MTFGSVSSSRGDLVDADGDKVSSRTKYYADPTSKQADLDGVTFEPGRNTKTTVTIDFTPTAPTIPSATRSSAAPW